MTEDNKHERTQVNDLKGVDIRKRFYIRGDENLDGSLDIESEGPSPQESLDDQVAICRDIVEDFGGVQFVIECRVVRKVIRGRTRVETLSPK